MDALKTNVEGGDTWERIASKHRREKNVAEELAKAKVPREASRPDEGRREDGDPVARAGAPPACSPARQLRRVRIQFENSG